MRKVQKTVSGRYQANRKRSEREKGKRGAQENAHAALYRLESIPSGAVAVRQVDQGKYGAPRGLVALQPCGYGSRNLFFDDRSTFVQQFKKKMAH